MGRNGVGLLFGAGTEADMKDSNACIMWVTEGGLGLPNREYYFDEDKVYSLYHVGRGM